ncbi:MAG: lipopolysaccharide heptosyltransferase II [Candidatus Sumerlaeia bacterium]|nr:lipopolysaccharide heptosyltransferase II [Candidatus Sumerlaeia bacterium]
MTPRVLPHPRDTARIAVRLTNWVGDAVMNTPFLTRLRELYPRAEIVALARGNVAPVLEGHPAANAVWKIDDKTFAGTREAASRLRAWKPDAAFLLPNSMHSALLAVLGGARTRVGYARDGRRPLLTHPVELRPDDLAVHETRYYLRLLDVFAPRTGPPPPLSLAVADGERAEMRRWLAEQGIFPGQPIVAVNAGAFFGTAKRWLPQRYAEVAAHFVRTRGAAVVATGLASEADVAAEVCRDRAGLWVNAAGRMSLRQLMAFLAEADLLLTNDSGAMHLAAALGTPLVAVFGSTDWVTTAPLSPRSRIVRADTPCAPCLLRHCPIDHRCMTAVGAPEVTAAAEELLARGRRPGPA